MQRPVPGHYVTVTTAGEPFKAFVPAPLPPVPPVVWPHALRRRFDNALVALGRLDAVSALLPNAALVLYSFVRKEAVLSSQIEGTQSSLADLLLFEIDEQPGVPVEDARGQPLRGGAGARPQLFFKTHRATYYELLNAVRVNGDWERWLDFFAEGIETSATQAATANALLKLVNADRDRIAGLGRAAASALAVHQALQRQPITTPAALVEATRLTAATVNKSLGHLASLGIVRELTSRQRGRVFSYRRYVDALTLDLEPVA